MKKRKFTVSTIIVMLLVTSILLAGCGEGASTLEKWAKNDKEIEQKLNEMSSDELKVSIDKNKVVYTYQFPQTIDSKQIKATREELEKSVQESETAFTTFADNLSSESGVDNVTVEVIYVDEDGKEIFKKEFN